MWRWDQGRLLYFQFDVLRNMARVLTAFDGVDVSKCDAELRSALTGTTGMPFAPSTYTVKRNYARVFQCALLATFAGDRLVVSDICRDLASGNGKLRTVDDYLLCCLPRFRFPFPAFSGYDSTAPREYPFRAVIKLLLARREQGVEAKLSLDDVFAYLIANQCTGLEDISVYNALLPKACQCKADERRQVREMLTFASQLSLLKFHGGFLCLEPVDDRTARELLATMSAAENDTPRENRCEEFMALTALADGLVVPQFELLPLSPSEALFSEGDRVRTEHLRIERSGLLKRYYRLAHPSPVCAACEVDTRLRYPWTEYLLEIHHLLPLSSGLAITSEGTSLADVVGLCPSCHRAVHLYYSRWLKRNSRADLASRQEARTVFQSAVGEMAL